MRLSRDPDGNGGNGAPVDLLLWTSDLSGFLYCPHLTALNYAELRGLVPRKPQFDDPSAEVLKQRGNAHEARVLASFRAKGLTVVEVGQVPAPEDDGPGAADRMARYEIAASATLEAMGEGPDIIFQGTLFDGVWLGRTDFLRRVSFPSPVLGDWSYEVIDAKLTREPKAGHVLQISLYSDLLAKAQGVTPEHMYLALGGPEPREETFRVNDYAAYFRLTRRRFDEHLAAQAATASAGGSVPTTYPEPVSHCDICDWKTVCQARWHEDDHLSLVAGITRRQRGAFEARQIGTLEMLGEVPLPLDQPLEGTSPSAVERMRGQARVQLEGRRAGEPKYELLLPVVQNEGLAALPEPSSGDLFLDFESDRFHEYIGLEYLIGYNDVDGNYSAIWALDRTEEKAAFEHFIDLVMERWERYPDMHVYHYATYEQTALKRLAGRHSTRVNELDSILRQDILVDLYRVVRQGLRASVESYSIKRLEPFYGYGREVDLRVASGALAQFEVFLELGRDDEETRANRDDVEGYNKDDCISTMKLRNWLEGLRDELEAQTGKPVPRPLPEVQADEEDAPGEIAARVADLYARLTAGVPEARENRNEEQQALWLLAQMLDYHRREEKAMWWEYFDRCDMSAAELIEDRSCLGGLQYVEVVDQVRRSLVHRYSFPEQEHDLSEGDKPHMAAERTFAATVVVIDEANRTIDLQRAENFEMPEQLSLVPLEDLPTTVLRDSLIRLAQAVLDERLGATTTRSAADLLLRSPPRVGQAETEALIQGGEDELTAAKRLVLALDHSILAVQGPPGAGKTFTGARMILALLENGKRVGVTATSHKVIGNLLKEVCKVARETGFELRGIQKANEKQWCGEPEIERARDNDAVVTSLAEAIEKGTPVLVAGTSWLWAREDMARSVHVLLADEAGQFSLANALAVSQAANSLVLLGDPQQLEQPVKGIHPDGAEASALDHILDGTPTILDDQGLFLAQTWRLHPDICAFTSEQFYQSRLASQSSLITQRVTGPEPFDGTGLRLVPVEHTGNKNNSPEEVAVVRRFMGELLEAGTAWTDRHGETHPIGLTDILIVAPYNAQVEALRSALPDGAIVGTVDKFQGQEAPIVIYSMATSTPEDAPRGMEFLYSASRLNVATSRARCVAVIVASPVLFQPNCRTPRQMELANGYARAAEMAR